MKYKYEIYTCNNGNPTAIITNCNDDKMYKSIAEKIYEIHPNVDQVAVILNVEGNKCTFQLINGEFCGNACLSVSAFLYEYYKIKDATIINKVINENFKTEYIEIESKFDGKLGNLLIPKNLFLTNDESEHPDKYIVKMNGISHLIIPQSFGEKNEEYARKVIQKMEENNTVPDILGIIFLESNKIDPFIWIKRIQLLQHQQSCLSGSIAAIEYLQNKRKTSAKRIIQPTGEVYYIEFKEKYIDITGTLRKSETGVIEQQKILIKDIKTKISTE